MPALWWWQLPSLQSTALSQDSSLPTIGRDSGTYKPPTNLSRSYSISVK